MVPAMLTIGGCFLLNVWLPLGWAIGIPCFLLATYMGVEQYRLEKRRARRRTTEATPHTEEERWAK